MRQEVSGGKGRLRCLHCRFKIRIAITGPPENQRHFDYLFISIGYLPPVAIHD
jgi:hypothetical protein